MIRLGKKPQLRYERIGKTGKYASHKKLHRSYREIQLNSFNTTQKQDTHTLMPCF